MKPAYLVLIYLLLNSITASAQLNYIPGFLTDSVAKKCHVKTVSYPTGCYTRTESYDANGKITLLFSGTPNDTNASKPVQPVFRGTFAYDNNGNFIKEHDIDYTKTDSNTFTITFSYDKQAHLIKKYITNEKYKAGPALMSKCSYKKHSETERSAHHVTIYKYDNKGRLTEEEQIDKKNKIFRTKSDHKSIFVYDSLGHKVFESIPSGEGTNYTITLSYNDKGQCFKMINCNYDITTKPYVLLSQIETTYVYSANGLLLKKIVADTLHTPSHKPASTNEYVYDYTFY